MGYSYATIIQTDRDPLQDHCGIVAAFCTSDTPFFEKGLRGLQILQTRGYDGAGVWSHDWEGNIYTHKGTGMVNEVFSAGITTEFRKKKAHIWVYQVRYGTSGSFDSPNVQPLFSTHTQSGEQFVVSHNGQFAKESKPQGIESDTLLFTRQLQHITGANWDERVVALLSQKRGAWSLVIGTKDALYIARDSYGFRPLVYGHAWDEWTREYCWVVSSETSSLEAMGVTDFFELIPGTIAKITKKGLEVLVSSASKKFATCMFENVYIHHGAGKAFLPRTHTRKINSSPSVDDVRRRSGKIIAREAPLTKDDVDMVIGVPGTGIEGGMTYARSLDLPYFQAITDRADSFTEQRTFMTANIESIYQKVLEHFNFDEQTIKGRKVVLVDDSIVRGNITRGLIALLKDHYAVRSVHLRILSPPIDKACHLGVNTRSNDELIAAKHMNSIESIRKDLQADSLAYISTAGLKEAITGDPEAKGFCMGCMSGEIYPIDAFGHPIKSNAKRRKTIRRQKNPWINRQGFLVTPTV